MKENELLKTWLT